MTVPQSRGQGQPPELPPHVLEVEESFIASLGWGLHLSKDQEDRYLPMLSAGLGLDAGAFVYPHCATIFRAIQATYTTDEVFTWPGVRKRLWDSGWLRDRLNETILVDITHNQFTTISGMAHYQAEIARHRDERGPGMNRGWQ